MIPCDAGLTLASLVTTPFFLKPVEKYLLLPHQRQRRVNGIALNRYGGNGVRGKTAAK
jgi:hypothetical protein